jgi:hypothetical protein
MPGPVPKRSDERIRRNKPEIPIDKIRTIAAYTPPVLDMDDPHPLTRAMYQSLLDSAQARYFEPSDWAYAKFTMRFVDGLLRSSRPSAIMLGQVNQMLTALLMTESERRRVRIEVERGKQQEAQVYDVAALFRQRLSQ